MEKWKDEPKNILLTNILLGLNFDNQKAIKFPTLHQNERLLKHFFDN